MEGSKGHGEDGTQVPGPGHLPSCTLQQKNSRLDQTANIWVQPHNTGIRLGIEASPEADKGDSSCRRSFFYRSQPRLCCVATGEGNPSKQGCLHVPVPRRLGLSRPGRGRRQFLDRPACEYRRPQGLLRLGQMLVCAAPAISPRPAKRRYGVSGNRRWSRICRWWARPAAREV